MSSQVYYNPVYEHEPTEDKIPIYNNYDLDKNFLKKIRTFLIAILVLIIINLLIFLLIRPGDVLRKVQKNYDNDREYSYMIYTHIGSYLMAVFSISLLIALLNYNRLTVNMIIFPSFVFALKVLTLAGYYFYYTNSAPNGYDFNSDYFGWVYLIITIILASLYITIFIKSIQEKNRIRRYNLGADTNTFHSSSINDLINASFRKVFDGLRVNGTYSDWLKSYVRRSLRRGLSREDLLREIDDEMKASRAVYESGEKFFTMSEPPSAEGHELFTSFLNHYYSGGQHEDTLPPTMMKTDLRGNEFLNPKILTYVNQLVSSGKNTNQIMDYLPFAHDRNGDMRERISQYVNQLRSGKRFRNFFG